MEDNGRKTRYLVGLSLADGLANFGIFEAASPAEACAVAVRVWHHAPEIADKARAFEVATIPNGWSWYV